MQHDQNFREIYSDSRGVYQEGLGETVRTKTPQNAAMTCKTEFLSLRQIAAEYQGAGTVATWRCRLRRDTRGFSKIVRKVGGSVRVERQDLERYIGSARDEHSQTKQGIPTA